MDEVATIHTSSMDISLIPCLMDNRSTIVKCSLECLECEML